MAKGRGKTKPKARPTPAAAPPPPPPPPAAVVPPPVSALEEPEERASTRARVATAAVVVACAAGTFLLLSGWTPGPGQPAPKKIAAASAPVQKNKVTPTPKSKPRPKPKRARAKPKPPTAQQLAKEDFQGQCGFCHTLAAAGTTGTVGPDLDQLKPTEQRVLDAIAAGGRRTGLMPPGLFGGAEARRVAAFVAKASRR